MTEDEVKVMESKVLEEFQQDDAAELEWLKLQLDALVKEERQLIAMFRMQKAMRDDAKMTEISKAIDSNRNMKKYAKNRIIDLKG